MYLKKFTGFCQVLKKVHTKESGSFFCLTVYVCVSDVLTTFPAILTSHRLMNDKENYVF